MSQLEIGDKVQTGKDTILTSFLMVLHIIDDKRKGVMSEIIRKG